MKNYLLTDFNTERWKGINMESIATQVEKLNEKINKILAYYQWLLANIFRRLSIW